MKQKGRSCCGSQYFGLRVESNRDPDSMTPYWDEIRVSTTTHRRINGQWSIGSGSWRCLCLGQRSTLGSSASLRKVGKQVSFFSGRGQNGWPVCLGPRSGRTWGPGSFMTFPKTGYTLSPRTRTEWWVTSSTGRWWNREWVSIFKDKEKVCP